MKNCSLDTVSSLVVCFHFSFRSVGRIFLGHAAPGIFYLAIHRFASGLGKVLIFIFPRAFSFVFVTCHLSNVKSIPKNKEKL